MKVIALLIIIGLTSACYQSEEISITGQDLTIFIPEKYASQTVFQKFEEQFGVSISATTYEQYSEVTAKLIAKETIYDLIWVPSEAMDLYVKAGMAQKLDSDKIPNLINRDKYLYRALDGAGDFALIYLWGGVGIGYNSEKLARVLPHGIPNSFDMIFDYQVASKVSKCGIGVIDDPSVVIGSALAYAGYNPNSQDKENLASITEMLTSIPLHTRFSNASDGARALANGNICILLSRNLDIQLARNIAESLHNNITIKYSAPPEGGIVWLDTVFIPNDAPHPDLAHIFINYALDPEVSARITIEKQLANSNAASWSLLDKGVLQDSIIFPKKQSHADFSAVLAYNQKYDQLLEGIWKQLNIR